MACYNSIVVPASADQVWAKLRNFLDMSWCPGVIESLDVVGDTRGTEIGAKRVLNGVFHETLQGLDDSTKTLRYSIDDGPDAVSKDNVQGYIGEVKVFPVSTDNTAFVVWSSSWASGGEGAKDFCDPIYGALLAALKEHFS